MALKGLAIPYMGSKRKLAYDILSFIQRKHPEATTIHDIFGGGGAISFTALQLDQFTHVRYNELDPRIFALVEYVKNVPQHRKDNPELYTMGQIYEDKFYGWVSRESFNTDKQRMDWYGGYLQSVWSFGNKGSSYLFGKELEHTKYLGHMVAVYKDVEAYEELKTIMPTLPRTILDKKTIYQRRLIITRHAKQRNHKELERLQQPQQPQQLERLQQLEQLQRLQQLERLELTNLDYKDIDPKSFKQGSVVYLDPPYINTATYEQDGISHDDLYKWIDQIDVPVYLSSYESPLKPVKAMNHRTTLSGTARELDKSKRIEWLFYNGK